MITFYGSRYIDDCLPVEGSEVSIAGLSRPAVVNNDGMYIFGSDGKKVRTCYITSQPHPFSLVFFNKKMAPNKLKLATNKTSYDINDPILFNFVLYLYWVGFP